MKKVYNIIVCILALLSFTSCLEALIVNEADVYGTNLTLNISTLNLDLQTKSTKDGVEAENENVVKTLDYFLYVKGQQNAPAILSRHVVLPQASVTGDYDYKVGLEDSDIQNLFPSPQRQCDVLVVANWPSDLVNALGENSSYEDVMQTITAAADFVGSGTAKKVQDSFVMVAYTSTGNINRNNTTVATADVQLRRLASKITLGVSVAKSYHEIIKDTEGNPTGETADWTPNPDQMGIVFYNCNKKSAISGDPADLNGENALFSYGSYSGSTFNSARTFSSTGDQESAIKSDDILKAKYGNQYTCDRFYTYPISWKTGDDNEPYMIIQLYWTNAATGTSQARYYKIILPGSEFSMNTWYHINLRLSVLGSLSPNKPVVITPETLSYYVADWRNCLVGGMEPGKEGTEHNVEAEIRDARFLVVETNRYLMHNQDDLVIPFSTSHACEIAGRSRSGSSWGAWSNSTNPTLEITDYSGDDPKTSYVSSTDRNFTFTIDNTSKNIKIHHTLNNDTSSAGYDYSPITVTFQIRHADSPNIVEEITVVQYPALYITAEANSVPNTKGGVFVNNSTSADGNYGGVHGLIGTNTNKNMYIITTSVLPSNSKYILADPREREINNLNNSSSWVNGAAIEGGSNRKLSYYYPSGSGSDYNNIIAPKFRIASSYGVTYTVSYSDAQKRCASYQEDGYPAGRWRLATRAEVEYIAKLSGDGKIPVLLSNDSKYWCSGGSITPHANSTPSFSDDTSSESNAVRCVYDEWYWENSKFPKASSKTTFTWGDQER